MSKRRIPLSPGYHAEPGKTRGHQHDVYTTIPPLHGNTRLHVGTLMKSAVEAWRDAAVLSAPGMEAGTATTEGRGAEHESPVAESEAPGRDDLLTYEADHQGAWTWIVWAIQPAGPQLAAVAATEARAEAYRDVVAQIYPGARFFAERAPVNHVFGASDLRSVAGRAAVKSARQGYASPPPSQEKSGGRDA